jgi:membrane-associated phospholipid phosphatase
VLMPLVAAVGLAVRRRTGSWATLAALAVTLAGAIALQDLVKSLVGRPRPQVGQLVATATGYAFPSGHATQVAAVAAALALLTSRAAVWRSAKGVAWTIAVLISVMVGFSRVYLGVHWPTDVIAGSVLGGAWVAVSMETARRTVRLHRRAPGERKS